MKSFFKGLLTNILGTIISSIIFILFIIGIITLIIPDSDFKIKKNSILKINLSDFNVVERSTDNPFEEFNLSRISRYFELQLLETDESVNFIKEILNTARADESLPSDFYPFDEAALDVTDDTCS